MGQQNELVEKTLEAALNEGRIRAEWSDVIVLAVSDEGDGHYVIEAFTSSPEAEVLEYGARTLMRIADGVVEPTRPLGQMDA